MEKISTFAMFSSCGWAVLCSNARLDALAVLSNMFLRGMTCILLDLFLCITICCGFLKLQLLITVSSDLLLVCKDVLAFHFFIGHRFL